MKSITTVLVLTCFCSRLFCQDLTGTWLGVADDYKIVIVQAGDSCFGFTYDTGLGFCKANFAGKYDDSSKKLQGINTDFIQRTFTHGLSRYQLYYSNENNVEYLRGYAGAKQAAARILSLGMRMPVAYKKVSSRIDTTAFITATLKRLVPGPASSASLMDSIQQLERLEDQKQERKSNLLKTIETTADSIRLVLFDNGDIDNDTVTVFLDGKIIIDRLGLGLKPFEKSFGISETDSIHIIELMANNLGTIPPNTANLHIWAGKDKFELRLASDFSVNASIAIRRINAPGR